jgi:hypothetical protein
MVDTDAQWRASYYLTAGSPRPRHNTVDRERGGMGIRGKGKGKDDDNDDDDDNSNDSRAGQGGGFVGRRARGRGFLSFKGAGRRGQAQGCFTGRNVH